MCVAGRRDARTYLHTGASPYVAFPLSLSDMPHPCFSLTIKKSYRYKSINDKKKRIGKKRQNDLVLYVGCARNVGVLETGLCLLVSAPEKSISSKLITFLLVWHPDNPRPARVLSAARATSLTSSVHLSASHTLTCTTT